MPKITALGFIMPVKDLDAAAKFYVEAFELREVFAAITSHAPANFDCASRADNPAGSITNQADPHGLRVRLTKE